MTKIRRDQAEKPVHERIDNKHVKMRLGEGASRNTRQKPSTPLTEILSDEDSRAGPRARTRTISPKSTSMLDRHWKKQPWKNYIKKENRVQVRDEKDQESEEPTNSEYEEEDDRDYKVSKNKKNQRQ